MHRRQGHHPVQASGARADAATSGHYPGTDDPRTGLIPSGMGRLLRHQPVARVQSLDGWVRRRLRCVVWVQWKTRGRRYRELRRLNVPERAACEAIFSPKGPWRLSSTYAMHRAFTNAHFKRLGLTAMEKLLNA